MCIFRLIYFCSLFSVIPSLVLSPLLLSQFGLASLQPSELCLSLLCRLSSSPKLLVYFFIFLLLFFIFFFIPSIRSPRYPPFLPEIITSFSPEQPPKALLPLHCHNTIIQFNWEKFKKRFKNSITVSGKWGG